MNIIYLVYQNSFQANGGLESVTAIIQTMALKHNVVVVTQRETSFTKRWREAGANVVVWKTPEGGGIGPSARGIRGAFLRVTLSVVRNVGVYRLIRRYGIDLVHCNDPGPAWDCVFAARACGLPLVINLRDTKAAGEKISRLKYRIWNRFCACWILLSREMAEFYREILDLNPRQLGKRLCWTYSIVDPSRFRPQDTSARRSRREELGIGNDEFAVGFVAAFSPKKNQLEFIEKALPNLKSRIPSAKVWFLGDFDPTRNPYARECESMAASAQVRDICRFHGFVGDVARWYPALDAVVVPTRKEGLARCMIESIACGTPVVSFDVCSAREILEETGAGRVVSQGDYSQMVELLAEMAMNEAVRSEMGLHGIRVATERFFPDDVVRRHEEIYAAQLNQ